MKNRIGIAGLLVASVALLARGESLTVNFGPGEGQPAPYESVEVNLWPMERGAEGQSHISKEKTFAHTFEDLKPGRYMVMVSTFKMANVIKPRPGLFRYQYFAVVKEGEDETVTVEYKDLDLSTLQGDAVLEGVIQNAEGQPVPNLDIQVAANVRNIGAVLMGETSTGDDGAFRVEGVSNDPKQSWSVIRSEDEDRLGTIQLGSKSVVRLAPEVGMTAPDIPFIVLGEEGDHAGKLSDHAGKVVVIDFWATWCGPCQKPMAKMQTYAAKHPEWGDQVVLLALSIDDKRAALIKHLASKDWNETLNAWAGPKAWQSDAATAYVIQGVPTCFIVDTEGKVAATGHPGSMDIPAAVAKSLAAAPP